jgi:hypothetical protein
MDNMLSLLVKKLQESLYDLNMGNTMSTEKMEELWTLLHHLHYASYDSNSGKLLDSLIEYYG